MPSDSSRRRSAVGTRLRRSLLTVALVGAGALAVPTVVAPMHAAAESSTQYYLSLGDSVGMWDGTRSFPYLLAYRYSHTSVPGLRLTVGPPMRQAGAVRRSDSGLGKKGHYM